MIMLIACHTHTYLCKHADGNPEDYVGRAVEVGLDEIGCSDHCPMPEGFDPPHRMSVDKFRENGVAALFDHHERHLVHFQ